MAHISYGYKIVDGKAELDEVEAAQVEAFFHGYLGGLSLTAAGEKLNIKRCHASLGRMLSDAHYMGDDFYPAVIGEDIFRQAQEERQKRVEALGRNRNYFEPNKEKGSPFWTLLFCEECGSEFRRYLDDGKELWRCSKYLVNSRISCKSPVFSEDELVHIFTSVLSSLDIAELKKKPQKQPPVIEHKHEDPFKQAEYAYSRVKVDDFDYQTEKLERALQDIPADLTGNFLRNVFKQVLVSHDWAITFELLNGKTIRKELIRE